MLLLADSDMLYHPNWLQTLDRLLPHLHGVVRAASRSPYLHLAEYDTRHTLVTDQIHATSRRRGDVLLCLNYARILCRKTPIKTGT